jgi:hypothetical protein
MIQRCNVGVRRRLRSEDFPHRVEVTEAKAAGGHQVVSLAELIPVI